MFIYILSILSNLQNPEIYIALWRVLVINDISIHTIHLYTYYIYNYHPYYLSIIHI